MKCAKCDCSQTPDHQYSRCDRGGMHDFRTPEACLRVRVNMLHHYRQYGTAEDVEFLKGLVEGPWIEEYTVRSKQMRLYSFVNMYMGGIHAGIQTAHAISSMWRRYDGQESFQADFLRRWEDDHKTAVLLSGGDHKALLELEAFMRRPDNPFPWGSFNESVDALNGALTAIVIVIPDKLYNPLEPGTVTAPTTGWTEWEWEFYQRRAACGLAR